MTNLEIAQMIANEIDTSTHKEVEAMMRIVCKIHDIDMAWLFPVVSNLYAVKAKIQTVLNYYSEADAR